MRKAAVTLAVLAVLAATALTACSDDQAVPTCQEWVEIVSELPTHDEWTKLFIVLHSDAPAVQIRRIFYVDFSAVHDTLEVLPAQYDCVRLAVMPSSEVFARPLPDGAECRIR